MTSILTVSEFLKQQKRGAKMSRKYIVASKKLSVSLFAIFLASVASQHGVATADNYPSRPITIVVPFSPGGSTDIQARLVAKGLSERVGQPVIVENRPGAGGSIGAKAVAGAGADGYTLLFASTSSLVSEPVLRSGGNIDVLKDFASVTQITDMPFAFVVSSKSRHTTLASIIEEGKKQPSALTYASWGSGSAGHLLGEMFKQTTKTDSLHVPYKGEALGIADMIGGQITMMFFTPFNMSHITNGSVRPLAVTGAKRMAPLPNVPTFVELGYGGISLPMWFGFVAPVKTPVAVIGYLNKEINHSLSSTQFVQAARTMGVTIVGSTPAQFTERIQTDAKLVADLARTANIKMDN